MPTPRAVRHSPGPWKQMTKDGLVILDANGIPLGSAWSDNKPECEANARLMACAPELLEALKDLMDVAETNHQNKWAIKQAEKAVANALRP